MIEKKSKLLSIIESVNAIIWEYNITTDKWDYVSPQTKSMLGFAPEEWKNLNFWANNVHDEDKNWALDFCLSATSRGESHTFEYRFMKKSEGYIWLRDEVVVLMEDGKPTKLRGFMTDITELKEREEKIKFMSFHDELTSLYNRRFFEEELKRIDNPRNYPITVAFGDVNELKEVNDTLGHHQGDELLKSIATLLSKHSRGNDIVARWGGDEFAIIMPSTSFENSRNLIDRIQEESIKINHSYGKISIAFGLSTKTTKEENITQVFREAEKLMYQNKGVVVKN